MAQAQLAVHRTILIVDVEGFGDRRRTNPNQVAVRDGLYRALRGALADSGIPGKACHWEDRGDSVFILAPPEVPKSLFVELVPEKLVEALRLHNEAHPVAEQIRLRMAVHAGEVNFDDHGAAGQAINMAFRLLDADPLKVALAGSPGVLALIVSSWFFDEVVRHCSSVDWTRYRSVRVAVKETDAVAWVCLPDCPDAFDKARIAIADSLPVGRARPPMDVIGASAVVPTGHLPVEVRGRDRILRDLRRMCRRRPGLVIALTGLGGVGKSTIAAVLADWLRRPRLGRRRPQVWWVPAADQGALMSALVTIARQLGATRADLTAIGANTSDAADRLWTLLHQTRPGWLLIFDNVDEPIVLGHTRCDTGGDVAVDIASVGDGTGWLRPTRRGLVVVTSRNSNPDVWGRHARVLRVEPLAEQDAARVLLDQAPEAGDYADARQLARRLGGLPLALRLAGSYLGSDLALRRSFRAYRHALDGPGAASSLLTAAPPLDRLASSRALVTRTWELSLDTLDRGGVPQARPLLRLLSCYALAIPIPFKLLEPGRLVRLLRPFAGSKRLATAADIDHCLEHGLAQLNALGLIDVRMSTSDRDERALVIHPVVADTNRFHLRDDGKGVDVTLVRHTAIELVAGALEHLDHEQPADWPTYLAYGPHLHALLDTVAAGADRQHFNRLVSVLTQTARAHNLAAAVPASERLLRAALSTLATRPPDELIRLAVLQELAWPVASQGRPAEAEAMYREVLAARVVVLGPEHPETLRTRHELAWVMAVRGQLPEAEQAYRETLDALRRVVGSDHPMTLMTHHELGWAIARQSRAAEAQPLLLEAFQARQRLLGAQHPRTLKTYHELAWVTASLGHWVEAEAQYRALLDRSQPVLGAEHPDVLIRRHELAWILAEQGNHRAAVAEYRMVLDAQQRVLGDHHPDTVATRHSLDRLDSGKTTPAHHWA